MALKIKAHMDERFKRVSINVANNVAKGKSKVAQEYYTVLVIEDDPDESELMLRSFESLELPHVVNVVADGERAMDYLHQRGAYSDSEQYPWPQLIILDLRLQKMDGLEVLHAIKSDSELRKIPVVIYTSSNSKKDIEKAYQLKANSYLIKPTDAAKSAEVLREMGRYWLKWNQLPS